MWYRIKLMPNNVVIGANVRTTPSAADSSNVIGKLHTEISAYAQKDKSKWITDGRWTWIPVMPELDRLRAKPHVWIAQEAFTIIWEEPVMFDLDMPPGFPTLNISRSTMQRMVGLIRMEADRAAMYLDDETYKALTGLANYLESLEYST